MLTDRRGGAGPTRSHGLAWPSRRLGNLRLNQPGNPHLSMRWALRHTCGTLRGWKEEASRDAEGLWGLRGWLPSPHHSASLVTLADDTPTGPPFLCEEPGQAWISWEYEICFPWGVRGSRLWVPRTQCLLRPLRRRPCLQGGKRRCLDFTAKSQGKANGGNGRMCPSI